MQPIWELPLQAAGIMIELPNGGRVRIRPARADDAEALQLGFERLSEQSRYNRFFSARSKLSDGLAASLTDIDHVNHFAWGVFDPTQQSEVGDESGLGVASARLIRDVDASSAEAALTVADGYQGQGIGRFLMELLIATAADISADTLRFEILRQNRVMIALAAGMGAEGFPVEGDASVVEYRLAIPEPMPTDIPAGALYELLRHAHHSEPADVSSTDDTDDAQESTLP